MGIGDEIMAAGHARKMAEKTGAEQVAIVDKSMRPRWHEMWEGLPWIWKPPGRNVRVPPGMPFVKNAGQCRPYIAYPFTRESGQRWTTWRARDHIGAIHIPLGVRTAASQAFGKIRERSVILEPTVSPLGNPNKQWGTENWNQLACLLRDGGWDVVVLGAKRPPVGTAARWVLTPTFRHAAACLDFATTAVLPEGGLHHAAAATGNHAIVLFGPVCSVDATGYDSHTNVTIDTPGSPCGRWVTCPHCVESWKLLKPEAVADLVSVKQAGAISGSF